MPGLPEPPNVNGQLPFLGAATPEFFSVLGMTLIRGRLLTADDEHGRPVAVVNESMARGAWPRREAIGQCFRIGSGPDFDPETATGPPIPPESLPCREVVGVVKDMRQRSALPDGGEDRLCSTSCRFRRCRLRRWQTAGARRPRRSWYDPAVLAAAAVLVAVLAVIGGALPARTAARTNPQEMLRL